MSEPGGVPAFGDTHSYGPGWGDSWEVFRAADWDNLAANVPELLGVLGVAGRSREEQQARLREFTQTAPYIPCPFKPAVEQFLEGT